MGHQSLTSGMELRQNILVSGNADSTVKVWDITNGQCLQTLSGNNLVRTPKWYFLTNAENFCDFLNVQDQTNINRLSLVFNLTQDLS